MLRNLRNHAKNTISVLNAGLLERLGRIPVLGDFLRSFARRFAEGSLVTIKSGFASGLKWIRYKRYVNGYWLGHYELPLQSRVSAELQPGNIFFDVGANAGFFTLIAGRLVGSSGTVVAFEPLPQNVAALKENIELNRLSHCKVIDQAVSDSPGSSDFFAAVDQRDNPQTSTASLRRGAPALGENVATYRVKTTTLDQIAQLHGVPKLVKMDIEGGEGRALRGATGLLAHPAAPIIIMETHGAEVSAEVDFLLTNAGYRFYSIGGTPLQSSLEKRHFLAYPPHIREEPSRF